jgi:hypothetical protein
VGGHVHNFLSPGIYREQTVTEFGSFHRYPFLAKLVTFRIPHMAEKSNLLLLKNGHLLGRNRFYPEEMGKVHKIELVFSACLQLVYNKFRCFLRKSVL